MTQIKLDQACKDNKYKNLKFKNYDAQKIYLKGNGI